MTQYPHTMRTCMPLQEFDTFECLGAKIDLFNLQIVTMVSQKARKDLTAPALAELERRCCARVVEMMQQTAAETPLTVGDRGLHFVIGTHRFTVPMYLATTSDDKGPRTLNPLARAILQRIPVAHKIVLVESGAHAAAYADAMKTVHHTEEGLHLIIDLPSSSSAEDAQAKRDRVVAAVAELFGADACASLGTMCFDASDVMLEAVAKTTRLRVLSIRDSFFCPNFAPPNFAPPLVQACRRAKALVYAGGYFPYGSPFDLGKERLVPTHTIVPKFDTDEMRSIILKNPMLRQTAHDALYTFDQTGIWAQCDLFAPDSRIPNCVLPASVLMFATAVFVRQLAAPMSGALSVLYHGTPMHHVHSIIRMGALKADAQNRVFTTPELCYALHPTYAVPHYFTDKLAVQFVVVAQTFEEPTAKQPATIDTTLPDKDTIEWFHTGCIEAHCIIAVFYARD